MNTAQRKIKVFLLLILVLLTGGCDLPVVIRADKNVCNKSVTVHLIGVNKLEKDRWDQVPMSEYWMPNNQFRESAEAYTYVIHFGEGPCESIFGNKDPNHRAIRKIWKHRKAEYLYVLADLPGRRPNLPGNTDSRRLRLPAIGSKRWKRGQSQIKIEISLNGVTCLSEIK
jgi:hypothetical protein